MTKSHKNLLLVHGFMGSALNWGPIVTRLKKSADLKAWNFFTPDLLGHGGRRGPNALSYSELTHEKLCADLKIQILESLPQHENFVALGHSFGLRPLLGLSTDSEIGPRMHSLLVEDASPEITQDNMQRLRDILSRVPVPFKSRDEAKATIEHLFSDNPRLAAFLFSNIRPQSVEGSSEKIHTWRFDKKGLLNLLEEAFQSPLWSEWSSYPGMIHLITGELSDHMTPERLQKALAKRVPKPIQHHQIAQSGHWIHSEQADTFTECVIKILKVL
jgi:pimeloyl-ACP methyl ester carboxylesterase